MLADALGRPVRFIITGGQVNDCTQATRLLEDIETRHVIAEQGYDSGRVLEKVKEIGASAVILPKSNRREQREYDQELYKERNLIERAFNKLKRFRRLATRYAIAKHCTSALSCIWRLPSCGPDPIVDLT